MGCVVREFIAINRNSSLYSIDKDYYIFILLHSEEHLGTYLIPRKLKNTLLLPHHNLARNPSAMISSLFMRLVALSVAHQSIFTQN